MKKILASLFLFCTSGAGAQVGINNPAPDASAELDVKSATRGFLAPRMNTTAMSAISAPAAGLLVYNTDSSTYCVYTGAAWLKVLLSPANSWTASGSNIYSNNSGNVGIGTTSPSSKLHVSNGNLLVNGTSSTGIEVSGAGKRMFYDGNKNAFRMGEVTGDSWDAGNVGYGTFAGGYESKATGSYSFAYGTGVLTSAENSVAFGLANRATGVSSFVAGGGNNAAEAYAVALGLGNTAASVAETAIGIYGTNYSASPFSDEPTDRVFNIGNGTRADLRSDALTVLKSGNTGLSNASPKSTLDVNGSVGYKVKTAQATSTSPNATASIWIYTTGTGTITLPGASTCANRIYTIVNKTGGIRTISAYVSLSGSSNVAQSLANGTSVEIVSDGTNWYQIR